MVIEGERFGIQNHGHAHDIICDNFVLTVPSFLGRSPAQNCDNTQCARGAPQLDAAAWLNFEVVHVSVGALYLL